MLVILEATNQGPDDDDGSDNNVTWRNLANSNALYNALFNDPQLKEYWNALIQKGLLNFDSNTGRFKLLKKVVAFFELTRR